jgi:SH3 domain protein
VEELSEKLDDLRISEKVTWFLVGAAVLLVGWIIGLSMGLYNKKRRASYHF